MNLWHDLSLGEKVPDEFRAIIEIPRGSANKYEVDKETGLIKLDRVNYSANYYPFDYGFLPKTYWYDKDPLDAIVFSTHPLLPGLLLEARPVGLMEMIDSGDSDSKILSVPVEDPRFSEYNDIDKIEPHKLREIQHFFEHLKDLQGKKITVKGFKGVEDAKKVILESVELYKKKFQ